MTIARLSMRHLSRRERIMRQKAAELQVPLERVNLKRVLSDANGLCGICQQPLGDVVAGIDFDHIVALARGGAHRHDNLRATHTSCNRAKGAR